MSYENDLIKKIIGGIGGIGAITRKEKTPKEANIGASLNKLKDINIGQYDDLMI